MDRPSSASSVKATRSFGWLGLTPFAAFIAVFLLFPTVIVFSEALRDRDGKRGFYYLGHAMSGEFFRAFKTTAHLSIVTALAGGLIGTMLAYAIVTLRRPRFLKTAVSTFSGVASQMGGSALAFMFIATLGLRGLVTTTLNDWFGVKLSDHGFDIFSYRGIQIVYMFFQIPLMVIVMLPAIEGMKAQWREAASNLGASSTQYWAHVGIPVLMPAVLSGVILLFANAFSAFATADALTGGGANLVALKIGFYLRGNTINEPALGNAIAVWMILIVTLAIVLYNVLRKRTSRWLQ